MSRNRFFPLILGVILTIFSGGLRAQSEADPMTHGELAKKICFISGLAESMSPPITEADAVAALSKREWTPLGGWRVDSYATREDFYVVIAKYMGLALEGPPDQAQSYYHALATEGVFVDAAGGAADVLDPAPPRLSGESASRAERMVLMVKGTVEARREPDGEWKPLQAYDPIAEGMEIRTGQKGEASVAYATGCVQQISERTIVRVEKLSVAPTAVNAVIRILQGRTLTLVKPLPAGSSFKIESLWGSLQVDPAEGCEFQSVVEGSEPIALDARDRELAMGIAVLAPIEEGVSRHSGFHGKALGRHSNGGQEFLKSGQSLIFMGRGLQIGPADSFDFARIAALVHGLERFTHEHLLTESEVRAFLMNLSSGGTCELNVTPIGR
jgi:hypothetical protein